jgi:hypothetical protein
MGETLAIFYLGQVMDLLKSKVDNQKCLYASTSKAEIKIYSNNNKTFDVYALDGKGNHLAFKYDLPAKKAIEVFKDLYKKYS